MNENRSMPIAADMEDYRSFQAGGTKLVIGRAKVTSQVTRISTNLCFGVLHLGDHSIACGTGEYQGAQKYEAFVKEISDAFAGARFSQNHTFAGQVLRNVHVFSDLALCRCAAKSPGHDHGADA